ncbi:MAG: TonB-dependent siderophore receptor [Ottowia sp.]
MTAHAHPLKPSPLAAASALALALMAGAPALAREADKQEADQTRTLSEVVVQEQSEGQASEGSGSFTSTRPARTAAKLALSQRETPQSVTTITRERLEQQGLTTLTEVMEQTTGISVSNMDTERRAYTARGYSISNFQTDGMLGTYGGYVRPPGDTFVYDRVEVLRGAAGLSVGAGDPSATVNMVRKRPTRRFQGSAAVSVGTHSLRRGEIDLGGPLAWDGRLRGRVVAAVQHAGSFRPLYKQRINAFYGVLEADLGPATTASLGFERQQSDPRGVTWGTVPYWNADGSVAHLPHGLNLTAPWTSWNSVERRVSASVEHQFNPDWRLRAALTRADSEQDGHLWYGGSGYPRADGSGISAWYGRFPVQDTNTAIDVNVDGKFSAWGRRHDLVFGLTGHKRANEVTATAPYAIPPGYTNTDAYAAIPDWRTWRGQVPMFGADKRPWLASANDVEQKAVYAATRLHVAEPFKLVLGARYSQYENATRRYSSNTGALTGTSGYDNDGIFTPYAGLLWDFAPQWTAYASYTDIFQPQNYRDKNNQTLDPVVGDTVELGVKAELLDKRLNFSAALFRSKKDNLAEVDDSVPQNSLPDGGQAYRSSGKGNVIDGFEIEASGLITRQWNVFAGYSHTRSRNAKGQAINTTVPRNLLRAFSSYRFGQGLRWTVGGGLNLRSSIWSTAAKPTGAFNANGSPVTTRNGVIRQPAVWTASLMASYRFTEQLTLSLNVDNVFDKKYYNRVGFYNGVYAAEPRSARLTLRAQF